jgi:transposase
MTTFIGIDISKDTFDAATNQQHRKWNNTAQGITAFIESLAKTDDPHVVMEATGYYFYRLALALVEASVKVSVINPYQIHHHGQSQLNRHKTDKADAQMIGSFATAHPDALPLWQPESESLSALRQLRMLHGQLTKSKTACENQLHALSQLPKSKQSKKTLSAAQKTTAFLDKQFKDLEQAMIETLDEAAKQNYELLTTIKGIGVKNAMMLISLTGNFNKVKHPKAFADYIGIAPSQRQSGTSVKGSGQISKMGDGQARQLLVMAARVAKVYNPACKLFYTRLRAKGKTYYQALVAVANKLIHQVFAVINQKRPFEVRIS